MASILSSSVALVTGGCSGLGAACAQALSRHGARVVVADLASQEQAFAACHGGNESSVTFAACDVTDEAQVQHALDVVERNYHEPVNVAVNCAGIATAGKTLGKKGPHALADFARVLHVNTVGSFNVARLAAARMAQRAPNDEENGLRGCLIHTASIAAYEGQIGQVAYAASKGAIIGMTLPMARDLAPLGIRVMTIAPGLFETPLLAGLPAAVKAELGRTVPCPSRLGQPHEFGQLVVSILQNPMLNGSVIRLDGALRMPP